MFNRIRAFVRQHVGVTVWLPALTAMFDRIRAFVRAQVQRLPTLDVVRAFVRQNVEVTVWLPVLTVMLAVGWFATWWSGLAAIEVGPIIMDLVLQATGAIVALWITWFAKKAYWSDLKEETETALLQTTVLDLPGDPIEVRNAWRVLIWDRVQFVVMFLLVLLGAQAVQAAPQEAACVRDLIVRWEVGSEAQYTRRYQSPIWPGGASGLTWGLGYDGGHQPEHVIERDWAAHPHADRLGDSAGVTGQAAKALVPQYRDVIVKWALATKVFDSSSAPRYMRLARQAYGPGFDRAPAPVRCALTSETYNRGPGMIGDRRKERRAIRDVCLAADPVDVACVAQQLASSCRVWANDNQNGTGLCNRRRDEARVARGTRT